MRHHRILPVDHHQVIRWRFQPKLGRHLRCPHWHDRNVVERQPMGQGCILFAPVVRHSPIRNDFGGMSARFRMKGTIRLVALGLRQRSTSARDWPPTTRSTLPSGVICRGMSLYVSLPGLAFVAGRNGNIFAIRGVRLLVAGGPTRLFFGLCADGFRYFVAELRASGGFHTSM